MKTYRRLSLADRKAAIGAVIHRKASASIGDIEGCLISEPTPGLRFELALCLAARPSAERDRAGLGLLKALRDKTEAKSLVAASLFHPMSAEARACLTKLRSDKDPNIRLAATHSLTGKLRT